MAIAQKSVSIIYWHCHGLAAEGINIVPELLPRLPFRIGQLGQRIGIPHAGEVETRSSSTP